MNVVNQRVKWATVRCGDREVAIGPDLLVLTGLEVGSVTPAGEDSPQETEWPWVGGPGIHKMVVMKMMTIQLNLVAMIYKR